MLRNVIAPARAFTQIANAHIWDDDLSDSAFRLLVRALALSDVAARKTTVTELAAGLTGGRITADRARRQLVNKGLLHTTKRRDAGGQVRSESLVSSVPLRAEEAAEIFVSGRGGKAAVPGAGSRKVGRADVPSPGTVLPTEGTLGEKTSSPLPVPPDPDGRLETAEQLLLTLRQFDERLVLGSREAARLAPLAAEWLARGVGSTGLRHALTAGLPPQVKCPAALLRTRLLDKMPDHETDHLPLTLAICGNCERPFRVVAGEARCAGCRSTAPVQPPESEPARLGWRERVRLAAAGHGYPASSARHG
ncbi:hypothetical protein E6W39_13495 [Kitasatospora acidiphila]|uniref:Helix-turn-helix domain-containing protein n=1 Tax=Kitasatospora acidiphila TaxID=2567942 RepID=A0A540W253_9ACTN|nr:hypothetical protein [Kitasatospora acidiphila]TQF03083.1 hypothetical protein E6W39_13495 [Kitasatospora acidiphila]